MSSQSQSNPNRLTALDGLRGLSSLLVLATHLKLDIPLLTDQIIFLPLRYIVRTIMNTGNISVGFFFILCGFLMAYLYKNPKSYVRFAQKRYLRIFTVLIVSVVISFAVVTLGMDSVPMLLIMLLLVPLVFRIGYDAALSILKHKFVFWFFILIISSQTIVAFINYFIVFRIGAQEFFSLPQPLYTSFMFATNYTLTFIFGDYIPMVDGGYWSLVSEVLFYLIYPFIAWHIIKPLQRLSRYYWIAWYIVSMATCYGLSLLFKNLLSFNTAHIHFAHFFTVGMIIALAYKEHNRVFQKTVQFFETSAGQVTSIFLYVFPVASAFWLGYISSPYTKYIVAYGLAPFMGLAVIALIAQRNILARFLRTPVFLFLGAISFPLYVIHSPIVHVLWQTMKIDTYPTHWLLYTILSVVLSIVAAYYLHILIERFYFVVTKQMKQNEKIYTLSQNNLTVKVAISSLTICLVLIFVAFQQDFSLLSFVQNHTKQSLVIKNSNDAQYSLLESNKIQGKFLASEDNLGIITMKILHIGPINQDRGIQEKTNASILIFRMREEGNNTWYHESQHIAWKISSEKPYPFGFPEISHSRNRWFEFELESRGASNDDYTILVNPQENFKSVYKTSKTSLINKPLSIIPILRNKVHGAFSQEEAQIIFGIYLFTMWFVWFVQHKAERVSS